MKLIALFLLALGTASAQITGFSVVQPSGVPNAILTVNGSLRRVFLDCTGCSLTNTATWAYVGHGGATATLTPSASGNWVDVVMGGTAGSCPVTGSYTITPTSYITLTATSVDDGTKTGSIQIDECSPVVSVAIVPFYRVLYSGQKQDVQCEVLGSSNTGATWAITQQPTGGNATLSDTAYADTVFSATVAGLYKITCTSTADNTKTAYFTAYVTGNTQPRNLQPNGTEVIDPTVDPNTTGPTIDVGPSQSVHDLEGIVPSTMVAGTTVKLHNETTGCGTPTHYPEWLQITNSGTHDNPIRYVGVPDSCGNLPVIEGEHATARSDILDPTYVSGIAGLMIFNQQYSVYPTYSAPQYVIVEGIAFDGYKSPNTFCPAGSGSGLGSCSVAETTYGDAAGIRIQQGRNIEFNGIDSENSAFCMFTESNVSSNGYSGLSMYFLEEGNKLSNCGVVGNYEDHNDYEQTFFHVAQFNQFPAYTSGAAGSMYKDRGNSVFRYNYTGCGAARSADLVDDQDASQYLDPNYYLTNWLPSNPTDAFGGDNLAAMQEMWHSSFAGYGNSLACGQGGTVHFWADGNGAITGRIGRLAWYNNTANLPAAGVYRFSYFDTGDNGDNIPHVEWPVLNIVNNALSGFVDTASPYFSWGNETTAYYQFGSNLLPTNWGTNVQTCTDNSLGACDGTGWPYQANTDAYIGGAPPVQGKVSSISGFSTAPTPFNTTTYALTTPTAGQTLPAYLPNLPVRFNYQPNLLYPTARTTVVTQSAGGQIGAVDSGAPPVSGGMTVTFSGSVVVPQ